MPWEIKEHGAGSDCPFEVVKQDTGERVTCHPTREKAMEHMKALYANTPEGEHMMREASPLETRDVALDNVNHKDRLITVIVAPYNQPTYVPYRGEVWQESYAKGCFGSAQRAPNRVRANRDHNRSLTVGKVKRFWDDTDDRGLIADVRIAQTDRGDETLALAEEQCLSASAGFRSAHSDSDWNRRAMTRVIRSGYLDHVAFVEAPAYEGAEVLAVREEPSLIVSQPRIATPNLDECLYDTDDSWRWAEERLRK